MNEEEKTYIKELDSILVPVRNFICKYSRKYGMKRFQDSAIGCALIDIEEIITYEKKESEK